MGNKCEWKDGELYPCEIHAEMLRGGGSFMYFDTGRTSYNASFCPSCGADIRKPKEKQYPEEWSKEKWIAFYHAVKEFME